MGFSGHLVFARTERPLLEAPLFGRRDPGLRDDIQEWWTRPGGWQTLQLSQGIWEDEYLFALAEWTGAPACVADVSDRSIALVTGQDPNGRHWHAWLNLDNAVALLVEEPEDVDDMSLWLATAEFEAAIGAKRAELDAEVPTDAAGALLWASVAGVHKRRRSLGSRNFCVHARPSWRSCSTRCWMKLGFPEAAQSSPAP
ncbi:hypothetical protein [Streptomyces sp. NPDC056056]|uniref:hypothetical protein n=1 Tax=Streptomyces sp. NPDC056056 TaxID=3345698 RepID=UPI0035DCB635